MFFVACFGSLTRGDHVPCTNYMYVPLVHTYTSSVMFDVLYMGLVSSKNIVPVGRVGYWMEVHI